MVTHISTIFSYNYDHIILQAYTRTLTAVFKTQKSHKSFQLETSQGNNELK